MSRTPTARRQPRPLDAATLQELAVAYVGRFATTRAKLRAYLRRKLAERGWAGERPADIEALVERVAGLGFIDDAAWALAKARSLTGRGYGARRVGQALHAAGVEGDDGEAARRHADAEAASAALRFAERRRLGPFAAEPPDRQQRERGIAAMLRAGHGFALARAIVDMAPGEAPEIDTLARFVAPE